MRPPARRSDLAPGMRSREAAYGNRSTRAMGRAASLVSLECRKRTARTVWKVKRPSHSHRGFIVLRTGSGARPHPGS